MGSLTNQQTALLLALFGAALIYLEFLRPGWILPGAAGATLVTLALSKFIKCPLRWPGMMIVAAAAVCFLLAARDVWRVPLVVTGSALIACGTVWADRLIGFSLGVPFSIVTGYLVNAGIQARRNKTLY